jgi:hypothetical protein
MDFARRDHQRIASFCRRISTSLSEGYIAIEDDDYIIAMVMDVLHEFIARVVERVIQRYPVGAHPGMDDAPILALSHSKAFSARQTKDLHIGSNKKAEKYLHRRMGLSSFEER